MPGGGITGWFCIALLLNKCPTGVPGKAIQEVGQRELLPGDFSESQGKDFESQNGSSGGKNELNHCGFRPHSSPDYWSLAPLFLALEPSGNTPLVSSTAGADPFLGKDLPLGNLQQACTIDLYTKLRHKLK